MPYMALENFQAELANTYSIYHTNGVRVGLQWPSVASCILIHKLIMLLELVHHFCTKLMLITAQSSATTQRLYRFKFTMVD